jgi:SAM-dependent methyltransferase
MVGSDDVQWDREGPPGDVMLQTFRLYEHPVAHEVASGIIRQHSTNPRDVREVALDARDLSGVHDVLDLGCGFGYMGEEIARHLAVGAVIVGVDAYEANRVPFTHRVRATGREAHFVSRRIDSALDWPDHSFDLVVASYSLYFFPQVIPDVARLLRRGGRLLAVTHSEESLRDMVRIVGLPERGSALLHLVRNFSAETGADALGIWFESVERIDYPNSLVFQPEELEDLLVYLQYKFKFLSDWPESEPELSALAAGEIRSRILAAGGPAVLDKSDAVFWAGSPRAEGSRSTEGRARGEGGTA